MVTAVTSKEKASQKLHVQLWSQSKFHEDRFLRVHTPHAKPLEALRASNSSGNHQLRKSHTANPRLNSSPSAGPCHRRTKCSHLQLLPRWYCTPHLPKKVVKRFLRKVLKNPTSSPVPYRLGFLDLNAKPLGCDAALLLYLL